MSGKGTKMSLGFSAVTESTVPAHLRNDLPPGTRPGSFVALLDSDSLARTVHFAPEIDYFKKHPFGSNPDTTELPQGNIKDPTANATAIAAL